MRNDILLPGVTAAACPPRVSCDAHSVIRSARRRALARDVFQIIVLLVIDTLFVFWPESRLPFLERGETLVMLRIANLIVLGDLLLARTLPNLSAKRIAATWSRTERESMKKAGMRPASF